MASSSSTSSSSSSSSASVSGASGEKIPFLVVYCSSSDDGHAAHELEHHTPNAVGWQSARMCDYPQQIVFRFPALFDVRKVQILSHQSKIASQIECHIGVSAQNPDSLLHQHEKIQSANPAAAAPPSSSSASVRWVRLGYLSLDANERSNYKARELKSVYVNARGEFLKLLIKRPHQNAINLFQQVGIVAVNIVGTKANAAVPLEAIAPPPHAIHQNAVSALGLHGLDDRTAKLLNDLHSAKAAAISAEDFDEAKRLKIAFENLKSMAHKLMELEKQKADAVYREDFDAAKAIKREMDAIRSQSLTLTNGSSQHHNVPQAAAAAGAYAPADERRIRPVHREDDVDGRLGAAAPSMNSHAAMYEAAGRGGGGGVQSDFHGHQAQFDEEPSHQPASHALSADDRPIRPMRQQQFANVLEDELANPPPNPPDGRKSKAALHSQQHEDDRPIRPAAAAASAGRKVPAAVAQAHSPAASGLNDFNEEDMSAPIASSRGPFAGTRPLPTQSHYYNPDMPNEDEQPSGGSDAASAQLEPLTMSNRKDAELLFDFFDEHAIASIYSKNWSHRQNGLRLVSEEMQEFGDSGAAASEIRAVFGAVCKIIRKALNDKVAQVVQTATILLQQSVNLFASKLRADECRVILDGVISTLFDKLSDSNARARDSSQQLLIFIATKKQIGPAVLPQHLFSELKKKDKGNPLPLKSRAKLLLKLLVAFGLNESSGLSLAAIMKFVVPQLSHRDVQVRDGVMNIIAILAKICGAPKLDPFLKDVRPSIVESVQAKIDEYKQGRLVFTPIDQAAPPPIGAALHSQSAPSGSVAAAAIPQQRSPAAALPSSATKSNAGAAKSKPAEPSREAASLASPASPASAGAAALPASLSSSPAAGSASNISSSGNNNIGAYDSVSAVNGNGHESAIGNEMELSVGSDLEHRCQFCNVYDPAFNEDRLDLHYWQECVCLIACKHCEQVIEIATLNEHLLKECESDVKYEKCPQCDQPIVRSTFAEHLQAADCVAAAPDYQFCPLCSEQIPQGDEGWKQHLLIEGCSQNPRGGGKLQRIPQQRR